MKIREKWSHCSLRKKLFIYLVLFVMFSLLIIWLFQVRLLTMFYQNVKKRELISVADSVIEYIGDKNEEQLIYNCAYDNNICVRIMSIDTERMSAHEKISVNVTQGCVIHHITDEYLSELCTIALGIDEDYIITKTHRELYDEGSYYPRSLFSPDAAFESDMLMKSMILIRTARYGNTTYAILLNSEITPVSAIVKLLSLQYLWIAIILLVGASLLALIIARNISVPIERMNRSAKKLATGEYNADFSGEGFLETRELADTLNYASKQLSATDKLQKELIANISHDLRTPLTMITGYSEMMRDIPGENTSENAQIIIDEATRLNDLVSDLLDLSRLQAGVRNLNIENFDLTCTVRDTMHRYSELTKDRGYRIEFYSDRDVYVNADRKMILQVIYNLINNAINYIGDDGLVIVTQTVNNGIVRISVTDHGEGIAKENLPMIWDRYYKVDKVHKRSTVGTGIGLSIVKNVMIQHGADFGVDSTVGVGSTFWFELPASKRDEKNNETDEVNKDGR